MIRCHFALAWIVLVVALSAPVQADLIAARTPFYDVDKDMTDDTLLCWAAAASNVLMSTGWAVDYNGDSFIDPKADVYQEFRDHFPDVGGWAYVAYDYYFAVNHPGVNYHDYYERVWGAGVMQAMVQSFARGFPVVMDFHGTHKSNNFEIHHAITAWAVDLGPDGNGKVYVTDSDDIWNWNLVGTQAYDIYWEQGPGGKLWYIDYYGDEFPHSDIRAVEVLVPEPGVLILLLVAVGLAVSGGRGWPGR